jgi:hypothetical protein
MNYSIIVWHRDDMHSMHQSILMSAITLPKLMRDFKLYMRRPVSCRSFNQKNLIQLCDKEGNYHNIAKLSKEI